jgi:hypothetical protein
MRARLVDSNAWPWGARAVPLVSGAIALCAFFPVESPRFRVHAFFAAIAVLLGAPLLFRRGIDREVRLELAPGRVVAYSQDEAPYAIEASQIAAASTAREGDKTIVSIERRRARGRPIHLELDSEDDARAVHEALGLGRGNVGAMTWRTAALSSVQRIARIAQGPGAFLATLLAAVEEAWSSPLIAIGVVLFLVTLIAIAVVRITFPPEALTLEKEALRSPSGRKLAYSEMSRARASDRGVVVDRRDGGSETIDCSISARERARLAAQIAARVDVGDSPRSLPRGVASLGRGGERARDWLARIDALAKTVALGAGYRESELDEKDLWSALADPEAPSDVRAGAARILLRVAPDAAPKRIESTLAVVHDPVAKERIRIATDDDLDAAAKDLERLDARATTSGSS